MNYSEMTDFEINCAVAKALGMGHAFFFSKSEDDFCEGIELNERGPIWQSREYVVNGYRVSNGNCFNPCNLWADAGPIIEANKLSINAHGLHAWMAWKNTGTNLEEIRSNRHQISAISEKPLRAAMECFLKVQEQANA